MATWGHDAMRTSCDISDILVEIGTREPGIAKYIIGRLPKDARDYLRAMNRASRKLVNTTVAHVALEDGLARIWRASSPLRAA
jgi:hypothetical protein